MMVVDWSFVFMLVGFLCAAWAVVGNDSIQTLGTFLSSNKQVKWYWLFAVSSIVMIGTMTIGWIINAGDLSWGRLEQIPQPQVFTIWHVIAPLALLLLTRVGIPVSTTFLVLSVFATNTVMSKMVLQSVVGYAVAFIVAYLLWTVLSKFLNELKPIRKKSHQRYWRIGQWFATMFLWSQWLMHDMANITVYLPRSLDLPWFLFVLVVLTFFLGVIFYMRGGKIQQIVLQKTGTQFIRSATIIDIVFALILAVFKELYSLPMSTTWVFVGLLAGRELAVYYSFKYGLKSNVIFPMLVKDFFKIMAGLSISVLIALLVATFNG